ncbi:MAG: glutamine-hydrolyzing carbamoyl-phosphate synthase small subunit [Lachnospiraceae bacterium]|nr:glutamine-hydrolyzing carbamoyl-phosphate synthase small subunit [Lachnospiraceae bacterium]
MDDHTVRSFDRKLITEDGQEYYGYGFGDTKDRVSEIVFNTSMAGYQEILSDPSYTYQAVVMTYPLIGNYGMAEDDYEAERPSMSALIVREYNDEPSNFRSTRTLAEVMKEYGIAGISGIDTRKLTRSIRDKGSRKALITDVKTSLEEGLQILSRHGIPKDAVSRVSRREARIYEACKPGVFGSKDTMACQGEKYGSKKRIYNVAAIDCGMKQNIVRSLNKKGCRVTVVPWNTPAEEIRSMRPDGVFISNGPGDPEDVPETIRTVKSLIGDYPVFGICLGHQILSLAYGAKTYKLKFGHRGGNHPVKDILTGKIEITSQNHSYAVDKASLCDTPLEVTHINLLDDTVEGVRCKKDKAFSVQYHPESAPGPQDSLYLFDKFIKLMDED